MQPEVTHFFSALGYSLFSSFWQMALIWLAVVLFNQAAGSSSSVKSALGFSGLLLGFVSFIITFISAFSSPDLYQDTVLHWTIGTGKVTDTLRYAAFLYLALLVLPLIKMAGGIRSLKELQNNSKGRIPGHLKIYLTNGAALLNIKRKVTLFASAFITSPLTIGFLKPVILLPVALINRLTTEQLEAIILHELAHIKRNDYLINLISRVILTLLYFNPFAKMLVTIIELEREKSADEWVLRFEYDRQLYASTLLHIASNHNAAANNLILPALGKKDQLLHRVKDILGVRQEKKFPFRKLAIAFLAIVLSAGFQFTRFSRPAVPEVSAAALVPVDQNELPDAPQYPDSLAHPVFAVKAQAEDNEPYTIRPIPVIEQPDHELIKIIIQPKIQHDENGRLVNPLEAVQAEALPSAMFVSYPAATIPLLDSADEQKVQESLALFKKLYTELNWIQLEKSLAETVSEKQKQLLKLEMEHYFNQQNWKQKSAILRSLYNDIDWEKASENLNVNLTLALSFKEILADKIAQTRVAAELENQSAGLRAQADSLQHAAARADEPGAVIDL